MGPRGQPNTATGAPLLTGPAEHILSKVWPAVRQHGECCSWQGPLDPPHCPSAPSFLPKSLLPPSHDPAPHPTPHILHTQSFKEMLRAAFRSGRSTEELVNGMQSEIFMAMGVQVGARERAEGFSDKSRH